MNLPRLVGHHDWGHPPAVLADCPECGLAAERLASSWSYEHNEGTVTVRLVCRAPDCRQMWDETVPYRLADR